MNIKIESDSSIANPSVTTLLPHHLDQLQRSAISDQVRRARGYYSVTSTSDVKTLGFTGVQARVPALLVPLFDPRGERVGCQIRPDQPRTKSGKPIKYESLRGVPPVLDVNPLVRERLADPNEPLWITEGVKKGDALVSAGVVAIALNGVWGWRGKNAHGGTAALPDWEYVPLKGRWVKVVFDSDLATNKQVSAALHRFTEFLLHRGVRP